MNYRDKLSNKMASNRLLWVEFKTFVERIKICFWVFSFCIFGLALKKCIVVKTQLSAADTDVPAPVLLIDTSLSGSAVLPLFIWS